ncbi:MAG TPA: DUF4349 domain-containing protein [Cellulomonas sp.]
MRTQSRADGRAQGRSTTGLRRAGAVALAALLLAGCSAGGGSADSTVRQDQAAGGAEQAGPAEVGGADSATDAGQGSGSGTDAAEAVDADAGGRQVITTGEVTLVAPDPRAAADAVVDVVEGAGGRVDARQETAGDPAADPAAGTGSEDGSSVDPDAIAPDTSSAALTVRVPAEEMTTTLDALDGIGEVDRLDLRSDDVTGSAQDLDARIRAARVSVTRLEDLLARAATTADVIAAEETLAQRQSSLEQLESERARLGEQVALSTLTITITATPADPVSPAEARGGFLGGLQSGWSALVTVLGVTVVILGTLLPWIALAAVFGLAYVAVRRWLHRRRADATGGPTGPASGGPQGPDGAPDGPDTAGAAPEDVPRAAPVGAGPARR